jgi:hypothetical protein
MDRTLKKVREEAILPSKVSDDTVTEVTKDPPTVTLFGNLRA